MAQPNDVFTINDIRAAATAKLDSRWAQYINEGSMDLITVKANEAAFDRYRIMPRILRDVAEIDTTTTIFGSKASFPFGFSPAAMHCLAHPDGEIATSRAAAKTGIAMDLSHWATKSLEDVIAAGQEINPSTPYAIQTSSANPKHHTASLLARASKAGYKAVLVTVDAPVLGRRLNEYRNGTDLPPALTFPNLSHDPRNFRSAARDASASFATFLPWLVATVPASMEIWLKGVYAPEDVELAAAQPRVRGVVVSNHGGRQLDGAAATVEALPGCAAAARRVNADAGTQRRRERLLVGVDGGIRRGSDVFKALALGADVCFAGRVPLWGLAWAGREGVERAVGILRDEFETCMRLAGCRSLADIGPECLAVVEGGVPGLIRRLPKL
ncbi:FMN-dependent dehydrogenase family protein [Neofusicoccum parvum]|uniref:FMN-dependent dehydrogenase family protein n=1 Tax=Neofusicoccum parvum TaxID=310453 RepID=A0ACB5SKL9_9PEZI|nr:FMN-dependent dehydrogenase family protein [Neofusicoccum parvum]